jgi:hypothetical protein
MAKRSAAEINKGRFERRISNVEGGHWIWKGSFKKSAPLASGLCYKHPFFTIINEVTDRPKNVYARRWIWEQIHGKVPDGLVIANVCGCRECVCPGQDHNKPVKNGYWDNGKKIAS